MAVKRNGRGGHDRHNNKKFPLATWLVNFLNYPYPFESHESAIQDEVRLILSPLWKDAGSDEIKRCLWRLISEANQGARPQYTINPEHLARRGHDQRKLRIGNSYWVINRSSFGADLRGEIFRSIVSAMEQNEFGRVRLCAVCKKYFVAAEHFRLKECSDGCRKFRNTATSAVSMRKLRESKRFEAERKRRAEGVRDRSNRDIAGFKGFSQFMMLRQKNWDAKNAQFMELTTKAIPGRLNTLREWDKDIARGESLETLWKRFPEEMKNKFVTAATMFAGET